jgi:hypothetical protein
MSSPSPSHFLFAAVQIESGLCPDADLREAHAFGDLPQALSETIEAHLATCAECREIVTELRQAIGGRPQFTVIRGGGPASIASPLGERIAFIRLRQAAHAGPNVDEPEIDKFTYALPSGGELAVALMKNERGIQVEISTPCMDLQGRSIAIRPAQQEPTITLRRLNDSLLSGSTVIPPDLELGNHIAFELI